MPESIQHKVCKMKVAEEIGGKTEVWSADRKRRYDVKKNNLSAQVKCRRGNEGKMSCVVEFFLTEKSKDIFLGRRDCEDPRS